jgi:hypothetical protein
VFLFFLTLFFPPSSFQPTVILIDEKSKHLQVCPLASVTCGICQKTHLRQDAETHITQNLFSHIIALGEQLKKPEHLLLEQKSV